jgi:uncharacterized membrane protein
MPSVVLGVATVPLMAWMASCWLGPASAVPAAWLAAGSPFLLWYSQEARNYALLFPCVCVGAVALLGLRRRLTVGRLVGFQLASTAGLLANLSYALLAPLAMLWWMGPKQDRARRLLVLAGVVAVMVLALSPWVPRGAEAWDWRRLDPGGEYRVHEVSRGTREFHPGVYPFTLHAFAVGYSFGPAIRELRTEPTERVMRAHAAELAVVVLLFGALAVLAWRAAARRKELLSALTAVFAPSLLVTYGALQHFKVFHPRYVSVSFPFLLALVAAALADARPRVRLGLVAALVAVWSASLARHYFVPIYGKEDMRGAIAIVRSRELPGERVLAAGADEVVFYYYRGPLPVERYWLGWAADSARAANRLDAMRAGTPGVWLVWSRGEDLDPRGAFLRQMEARFPRAETWRTEGVRLWHLPGLDAVPATNP